MARSPSGSRVRSWRGVNSGGSAYGRTATYIEWDRFLGDDLRASKQRLIEQIRKEMDIVAQEMEAFAKGSHPWQNQTGDAERTFTVRVTGDFTIIAKHGVHYGIYLEVCNGGRYGIIPKTMSKGRESIRQALQRAWSSAWS